MTQYFLGVDIGSTKSHALICDDSGHVCGFASGGRGNHESIGVEGFRNVLHKLVADAVADAQINHTDIAGAGFGIAGYDWDEDTPMMNEVITSLGLDAPFRAVNDAGPGLLAGAEQGWGVSVTAGTSVNGRGIGPDGTSARMTGNGLLFAEAGGGVELVYHAIGLIARAWSKRGEPTSLTDAFIAYAGASSTEDLLAGIARGRYHINPDAALLVFEEAANGDGVAQGAIRWLGERLGDIACGIIRQLDVAAQPVDVVLMGSIFQGGDRVIDAMRRVVHDLAPHARFVHLDAPPVAGAVMLGMQQAAVDFLPLRERIIADTKNIVAARR